MNPLSDLNTLPKDIYELFNPDVDHIPSEENLNDFCENLKSLFRNRLGRYTPPVSPLRFSALGKPNRQIWYDAHPDEAYPKEALTPKTYVKFLYGDIIEQMLLFLAKEAGHTVELEQAEVEVDGVTGHIDAIIDGVVVDVKSASPFGYKKFETSSVVEDDPFGYVAQLSGYSNVLTPNKAAAWLANDKVSGDICVSYLDPWTIKEHKPEERIKELRDVITSETPPELCYSPIPDGKSGNLKLGTGCSYCGWKYRCHPNLRTFIYSTGPRFLTEVVRVPDVPEVTK